MFAPGMDLRKQGSKRQVRFFRHARQQPVTFSLQKPRAFATHLVRCRTARLPLAPRPFDGT